MPQITVVQWNWEVKRIQELLDLDKPKWECEEEKHKAWQEGFECGYDAGYEQGKNNAKEDG